MTTLYHPPVSFPLTAPPISDCEQCFVIYDVTWDEYIAIGEIFADRPALRITYDQGTLEFRTSSSDHERYKHWLGRFLETIAEELSRPIMPSGSMTFQRKELERGFEPDQCYWIANESAVRTKRRWKPEEDPSPDLMIEIEISHTAAKRMSIFAAFRIPEVWCCDGEALGIYLLQDDGQYQLSEQSLAFPTVPVKELVRFLPMVEETGYFNTVAAVRAWVRTFIGKTP